MAIPGRSNIAVDDSGDAWVRAFRCSACGTAAEVPTIACRKCHARGTMEEFRAGDSGKLVTWSIVHRSFPGIEVPFVSAIVRLDDGITIKGNLKGVDHDNLKADMPVRLVMDDAGGAKDKDGNPYVAYHFTAATADA
ncbi:MAG: OB-fold domain-containing protein [Novosphingobium sp.]|nr:OB-fold domain-containing protein [Novosphingobium sp.]